MASPISPPTSLNLNHTHLTFSFKSPPPPHLKPHSLSFPPPSTLCSCTSSSSSSSPSPSSDDDGDYTRWDLPFRHFLSVAAKRLDGFLSSGLKIDASKEPDKVVVKDVDHWGWDRWKLHFDEVEDQERFISILKSQLYHAIEKEDYKDAARLKVAIAAAATKDAVGTAMSYLKNAIEEERYQDAVQVRDNAAAGLVGWWAGVSDDRNDPHGCIIRISAEHGRYVARSYSPRQLAASTTGSPLFEIFVTLNKKGEYRHQAVYLKRRAVSDPIPPNFPEPSAPSSSMKKMNPRGGRTDIISPAVEDTKDDKDENDPDLADELSGFQIKLQNMIPGVRVKVKVTPSGKVDPDVISKGFEQTIEEDEEEDEEDNIEAEQENINSEDTEDEFPSETDEENDGGELDAVSGGIDKEHLREIAVKVVVRGLVQNLAGIASSRDLDRVPAKLKRKGRKSFSFCIEDDEELQDLIGKDRVSPKRKAKARGKRTVDLVMSDLVKSISRGEEIPLKVVKDIGDLISDTLSQARNRQPLSGSTTFSRIDLPAYPDPLNGLYVGSSGPYTSEVIQLKRKFGQWQEDGWIEERSDLHFYEYVEAVKLTGDPYVPAGQVAFRAKIGKRYQLPHQGIFPEELGVVARYKGQGRLAEPGYRNPRWVDGELVILDGKYIKGGPVVGFVYWDPEYQFLVFFNRLRIQE